MNCYYCEAELTFSKGKSHYAKIKNFGVMDHVLPQCMGGDKVPREINIVWSCYKCNQEKNGSHPFRYYIKKDRFPNWKMAQKKEFFWRVKAAVLYIEVAKYFEPSFFLSELKAPKWAKEYL